MGKGFKRELPSTKFGFQGWTVEEVLQDVMGMVDTRTQVYSSALNDFEKAIDEENYEKHRLPTRNLMDYCTQEIT